MPASATDPQDLLNQLNTLVHQEPPAEQIYQAIVDAAKAFIPSCDHASLLIARGDTFWTAASTDEVAARIDALEVELRQGPCFDAIVDEPFQFDADLADGSPWPELTAQVLAETPVRGSIGYRLLVDEQKVGALNLHCDTAGRLTDQDAESGTILATFASSAVMTIAAREEAMGLSRALANSREIGKAIGLVMASHKITDQEAFELLRKTSQDMNVKVADLAAEVVRGQSVQFARTAKSSPVSEAGTGTGPRATPSKTPAVGRPRPPR